MEGDMCMNCKNITDWCKCMIHGLATWHCTDNNFKDFKDINEDKNK